MDKEKGHASVTKVIPLAERVKYILIKRWVATAALIIMGFSLWYSGFRDLNKYPQTKDFVKGLFQFYIGVLILGPIIMYLYVRARGLRLAILLITICLLGTIGIISQPYLTQTLAYASRVLIIVIIWSSFYLVMSRK